MEGRGQCVARGVTKERRGVPPAVSCKETSPPFAPSRNAQPPLQSSRYCQDYL